MRCVKCKKKYPKPSVEERCRLMNTGVCPRCALLYTEYHQCDMTCRGSEIKVIDHQPLTDGFMGFGLMTQVNTTTEEFLPSVFRFTYAKIHNIEVRLATMNRLSVTIKMTLHGNQSLPSQVYQNEGWKRLHLDDTRQELGMPYIQNQAPIVVLEPHTYLHIMPESLRVTVDGLAQSTAICDRHEFVGTPMSDPPPDHYSGEGRGDYSYYGGKLASIYAPLAINKEYVIKFDVLAANPVYVLNFLFPYKYVDLENLAVQSLASTGVVAAGKLYARAKPVKSKHLTPEFEYKLNRMIMDRNDYPEFEKAIPFRETPMLISPDFNVKPKLIRDAVYPIKLDDYEMLSVQFGLAFDERRLPNKMVTQATVTSREIPVRIYEQMQSLPEFRDFLVSFDFLNLDNDRQRELEVESEIVGFTDKEVQRVVVPRLGGGQPARNIISQCPPLKQGILEQLTTPVDANLSYEVYEMTDNGSRTLIESGLKPVRLLSNDQIIWSLRDIMGGARYDLEPTIAAWIDPIDPGGLLEEVRAASGAYHPSGELLYNDENTSLSEMTANVKALYDCLNSQYEITYGEHPFHHGDLDAQRILTAPQVLRSKSGVCIDLVILFASLMEGIGINPLIMITNTHAFIGWGNKNNYDTMAFLECEMLGLRDASSNLIAFEEASSSAQQYFSDNFVFGGSSTPMFGLLRRTGKVVVDLQEVRNELESLSHSTP